MSSLETASDRVVSPAAGRVTAGAGPARAAAGLALLQTALFAVPLIVLGRAIGWPASLRLPAAEALPLIAAQADAVLLGYGAYLLVSLALIPLAFALRAWLATQGVFGWIADAVACLGAAAGLFKMLGIVRWLSVMPVLAAEYGRATDAFARHAIESSYLAVNAYAGAVGELLGVQMLSGLWLLGIGAALRQAGQHVLGLGGLICGGLFLLTALRVAIPEAAMIQSGAVPATLAWYLWLAVVLWRAPRA